MEREEGRGVVRNSWNQYVGIMEVKLMKRLGSVAWVEWPCRLTINGVEVCNERETPSASVAMSFGCKLVRGAAKVGEATLRCS